MHQQNKKDLSAYLMNNYARFFKELQEPNNLCDAFFVIAPNDSFLHFINHLKTDAFLSFTMLMSICCVDYPNRDKRFELIYSFLSLKHNIRLLVKLQIEENEMLSSISKIYHNSSWYEREIWDMYGILFSNHDDMRRILTDYGFVGHPMRKDFPLTGYCEVSYNNNSVMSANVSLKYDFRDFNLQSRNNVEVLPGDEKALNQENKQ